MINPQLLILFMSQTNFHGPKDVGANKIRLYDKMKIAADMVLFSAKNFDNIFVLYKNISSAYSSEVS